MSMTEAAASPAPPASGLLGSWVETHEEPCRGGRTYRLLVNHRTAQAIDLTDAEAALCAELTSGGGEAASVSAAALLHDLREQGFLASDPPSPRRQRRLALSLSQLDLRWNGAGRLVRAVHRRGARHLFHPAAIVIQVILALAGLAAVAMAVLSHHQLQLRVHPLQIPLALGLSIAAVAVHEFAHALVVIHHRRTVDGAGIRLHLGTPAFYVESAGALLLSRRQRLIQAAAGVWAEWQFTSVVALWLWASPGTPAAPLLHRFVILNAATIATNLLPFTGLDGSWLLADALGAPDLTRRCRGSITRLALSLAARTPITAEGVALAAYSALNSVVALGLLAAAGFFWYQLFGDLATTLVRLGPAGWLTLGAAVLILAMPGLTAAAPRLAATAATARDLRDAMTFRAQWRWRIPATRRLATAVPELAQLSHQQLGALAGHLHRTRTAGITAPGYGIVRAGTLTASTPAGESVTLDAGAVWTPDHRLNGAAPRTVLIQVSEAIVQQILKAC